LKVRIIIEFLKSKMLFWKRRKNEFWSNFWFDYSSNWNNFNCFNIKHYFERRRGM